MPNFILRFASPNVLSEWQGSATQSAVIAMYIWLLQRYLEGPPEPIGHTAEGIAVCAGPNGEFVEFDQRSKPGWLGNEPPTGAMFIRRIANEDPRV